MRPVRGAQRRRILPYRTHQLDADGQTIVAAQSWQRDAWEMQNGTDAVEHRVPRGFETLRRLARSAWHQQYIDVPKHAGNERAALRRKIERGAISFPGNAAAFFDQRSQSGAQFAAMDFIFEAVGACTLEQLDVLLRGAKPGKGHG